jgi:prepilin-type N-terminal cleavage/methylation domain-containing protein
VNGTTACGLAPQCNRFRRPADMRRPTRACGRTAARGFGLVELIVALTVFSVGVLALAGAAAMAQRAFASAEAIERAAHVAAAVIDSLLRQPSPAAGQRIQPGASARWTIVSDSVAHRVELDVEVSDGGRTRHFDFRTLQLRAAAP